MIDDRLLRNLAARQHGVVSVDQAVELGYRDRSRDRLADDARWHRAARRVLVLVGAPETPAQRAMVAVLDAGPGAVLDAYSAISWWGVPGHRLEPVDVLRPRERRNADDRVGNVRQPLLLPPHHVCILEGIPTVTPARAIFDIAGRRRRGAELDWWVDRVGRIVDTAWAMRLVSGPSLHAMFADLAQRGRPGIRVMRRVLEVRGMDYVPPASNLESRVARLLGDAGLPAPRRQVDSGDAERWIGRVDLRDPELPLIIEVQSERFHSSLTGQADDDRRIAALEAAGFVVVEVLEEDVWHDPSRVVAQVLEGRARAALRKRSAA